MSKGENCAFNPCGAWSKASCGMTWSLKWCFFMRRLVEKSALRLCCTGEWRGESACGEEVSYGALPSENGVFCDVLLRLPTVYSFACVVVVVLVVLVWSCEVRSDVEKER